MLEHGGGGATQIITSSAKSSSVIQKNAKNLALMLNSGVIFSQGDRIPPTGGKINPNKYLAYILETKQSFKTSFTHIEFSKRPQTFSSAFIFFFLQPCIICLSQIDRYRSYQIKIFFFFNESCRYHKIINQRSNEGYYSKIIKELIKDEKPFPSEVPDDGASFFSAAAGAHPADVITSVYLITANGARARFTATSDAANDVCNGIRWRGRRGRREGTSSLRH